MKVRNIGSNITEVEKGSRRVLFSYETPVAAQVDGCFYRTTKRWSVTTSRHINKWLDGIAATPKPQSFFDDLV